MGKFTFGKEERLQKEKHIKELFDKGSSFYLFPFKVFLKFPEESTGTRNQVLISISKRNFPRAVDRNLVKRRIREAYRTRKELLPPGSLIHIGFVYVHKEILDSAEISSKMVHALKRVSRWRSENSKTS